MPGISIYGAVVRFVMSFLFLDDEEYPLCVVETPSTCGRGSGRQPPFERLSTVPLIKASPEDVIPAENTRSREVMQKCDIDCPICNHEPVRKKDKKNSGQSTDFGHRASSLSPVSVTLKKNVIVITTCDGVSKLRQEPWRSVAHHR